MKKKKRIATALLAIGAVLTICSFTADAIGIGGAAGFGTKQVLAAITGIIVAGIGYVVYSKP